MIVVVTKVVITMDNYRIMFPDLLFIYRHIGRTYNIWRAWSVIMGDSPDCRRDDIVEEIVSVSGENGNCIYDHLSDLAIVEHLFDLIDVVYPGFN